MPNKGGIAEPKDNRMYEYHNTGDGAKISKDRPQLKDADAAKYEAKAFFSGWQPESVLVR